MTAHAKNDIPNLSRKALGIGIICGLDIRVDSECTITITRGCGLTSRGLLLCYAESHFKYYKPYLSPVEGLGGDPDSLEIWELLTERVPGAIPLTPQYLGAERVIDNKVCFLYLEDVQECIVKALLIDVEELWVLLAQKLSMDTECLPIDGVEPEDTALFAASEHEFPGGESLYCAFNRNTSLKPIHCMRFGFATDDSECDPEEREFRIGSPDFAGFFNELNTIIEHALIDLADGIEALHQEAFYDLFPEQQRIYVERYFTYLTEVRYIGFKQGIRRYFILYFYDLIKDLIRTYNELVEELCSLTADCCPDESLFPYHLLLGEIREDVTFGLSVFRHHFRQPLVYNGNRVRYQKIQFTHWKLMRLIKNFFIPGIESTEVAEGHYTAIDKSDEPPRLITEDEKPQLDLDDIKITPTRCIEEELGKQTIPFYYYVYDDPNSMHHFWDFDAVYCCKEDFQYSYYADSEESYTTRCEIKRPLAHRNILPRWLRIEGVIGVRAANDDPPIIDLLQDYWVKYNLNFNFLIVNASEFFTDPDEDEDYQLAQDFLGAEHIGGVKQGDTYVLVREADEGIVIADFWIPACCIPNVSRRRASFRSDVEDSSAAGKASVKEKGKKAVSPSKTTSEKLDATEGINKTTTEYSSSVDASTAPLDKERVYGMGESAKNWLLSQKIDTMKKLADMSPQALKDTMESAPSGSLRRMDVSTWPEQAQLFIAEGEDALKKLHQELKRLAK